MSEIIWDIFSLVQLVSVTKIRNWFQYYNISYCFCFQALCGAGQCLRALSVHESPDPPVHWIIQEMVRNEVFHEKNVSQHVSW